MSSSSSPERLPPIDKKYIMKPSNDAPIKMQYSVTAALASKKPPTPSSSSPKVPTASKTLSSVSPSAATTISTAKKTPSTSSSLSGAKKIATPPSFTPSSSTTSKTLFNNASPPNHHGLVKYRPASGEYVPASKSVSPRAADVWVSAPRVKPENYNNERLQSIVLINKVVNFCCVSFKRLHQLSTVTSSWRECVVDYSAGTWKKAAVAVNQRSERYQNSVEKNRFDAGAYLPEITKANATTQFAQIVRKTVGNNPRPDLTWIIRLLLLSPAVGPLMQNSSLEPQIASAVSCLHFALLNRSTKVCELLLTHSDLNVNQLFATSSSARSPLILAAQHSDNPTARLLLSLGAIVDDTVYGNSTPLHICAATNNYELAKLLIVKHKCNVNIQDAHGHLTPLMIAVMANNSKIVALICQKALDRVDFSLRAMQGAYEGRTAVEMVENRANPEDELSVKMAKYLRRKMQQQAERKNQSSSSATKGNSNDNDNDNDDDDSM